MRQPTNKNHFIHILIHWKWNKQKNASKWEKIRKATTIFGIYSLCSASRRVAAYLIHSPIIYAVPLLLLLLLLCACTNCARPLLLFNSFCSFFFLFFYFLIVNAFILLPALARLFRSFLSLSLVCLGPGPPFCFSKWRSAIYALPFSCALSPRPLTECFMFRLIIKWLLYCCHLAFMSFCPFTIRFWVACAAVHQMHFDAGLFSAGPGASLLCRASSCRSDSDDSGWKHINVCGHFEMSISLAFWSLVFGCLVANTKSSDSNSNNNNNEGKLKEKRQQRGKKKIYPARVEWIKIAANSSANHICIFKWPKQTHARTVLSATSKLPALSLMLRTTWYVVRPRSYLPHKFRSKN